MVRFLTVWVAVTLALVALVEWLPGVQIASHCTLLAGAVFLGALNAMIRPMVKETSWPKAPIAVGVVALTVNSLFLAVAQPVSMAWRFTTFGQDVLAATILTLISATLTLAWDGPMESSLEA